MVMIFVPGINLGNYHPLYCSNDSFPSIVIVLSMPSITKICPLFILETCSSSSLRPVIFMSMTSLVGIMVRRQGAAAVPLLTIEKELSALKVIGKYVFPLVSAIVILSIKQFQRLCFQHRSIHQQYVANYYHEQVQHLAVSCLLLEDS